MAELIVFKQRFMHKLAWIMHDFVVRRHGLLWINSDKYLFGMNNHVITPTLEEREGYYVINKKLSG